MNTDFGKGYRLLLVEDDRLIRMIVLAQLNKLGFNVEVAENGQQGLDAAEKSTFDLILMDCEMPKMDGFEATKRIRKNEVATGKKRVPILALTSHSDEDMRILCLKAGMDEHLFKPIEQEVLAGALKTWLKHPQE